MKKFSILIPSWNNLGFLKLCVESIRRHSVCQHQIIVHVNEGTDGTLQWVKDEGIDYTYSEKNIGVCFSMNMMRTKVMTDYICFLNDDMYVLPGWDSALSDEIERLPDNRFFLSATTIQPHTAGPSLIVADYGDRLDNFRERQLLEDYKKLCLNDWMGATMPPNVVHRDMWDLVGGYSVELTPGMYSDPDFTAKLWLCGVRYMKGLSASRVYHFESKSTQKVKKNRGQMQFLLKWGLTSSTFRRLYTYRGHDFDASLVGSHEQGPSLRTHIVRGQLKALFYVLRGWFRPII